MPPIQLQIYHTTLDLGTFFALSDWTHRGILERLGPRPATIGELAEPFEITLNGVKKRVGILEEVDDLVVTAKVGRGPRLQLSRAQLDGAAEWINDCRTLGSAGSTGSAPTSKGTTAHDDEDVQFAQVINAAPEEVFDAFTGEDGQKAFYSERGWIVELAGAIFASAGSGP